MYIYIYIYIWTYFTVNNTGLRVSEKSIFPTSFSYGRIQENLYSFEKRKWQQGIFGVKCLKVILNFSLTLIDDN